MDQVTSISLFVLLVALTLPVLTQLLARRPRLLTAAKYFIFSVYVLANLYETLLFRAVMPETIAKLQPFWSYRESLELGGGPWGALERLLDGELPLHVANSALLKEILLNILLYVPMGYLLPFLWPSLARPRKADGRLPLFAWRVVLIGFVCSAITELTQLVFKIGWFEFDDMINNTAGCLLGYVLYALIQRRTMARG